MALELPPGTIVISRSSSYFEKYKCKDIVEHNGKIYEVKADTELDHTGERRLANLYLYPIADTRVVAGSSSSHASSASSGASRTATLAERKTRVVENYDTAGRLLQKISESHTIMGNRTEHKSDHSPTSHGPHAGDSKRSSSPPTASPSHTPRLRARVVGYGYTLSSHPQFALGLGIPMRFDPRF